MMIIIITILSYSMKFTLWRLFLETSVNFYKKSQSTSPQITISLSRKAYHDHKLNGKVYLKSNDDTIPNLHGTMYNMNEN